MAQGCEGCAPTLIGDRTLSSHAVHWAALYARSIHAAVLITPPDLDAPSAPVEEAAFRPVPRTPLPFRSFVVASTTDPSCEETVAREWVTRWDRTFLMLARAVTQFCCRVWAVATRGRVGSATWERA